MNHSHYQQNYSSNKRWCFLFISLLLLNINCLGEGVVDPTTSISDDGPFIKSFNASRYETSGEEEVILSWEIEQTDKITHVSLTPKIIEDEEIDVIDSVTTKPHDTTNYTLTVYYTDPKQNTELSVSADLQITVNDNTLSECQSTLRELAKSASFSLSQNHIWAGETVNITWEVPQQQNLAVKIWQNDTLISEKWSGQINKTPEETTVFALEFWGCGESYTIKKQVRLNTFEKVALENIAHVYSRGKNASIWAGSHDGILYRSQNGTHFSKVNDNKLVFDHADEKIYDHTPLTSVIELDSGCKGSLFFATEGGFLFRSFDEGESFFGLKGGNYEIAYFAIDGQDPYNTPSAVHFIKQDPNDSKRLIIGHQDGLTMMHDCFATDASTFEYIKDSNSNVNFLHQSVSVGEVFQDRIYVATQHALYSSNDLQTWQRLENISQKVMWMTATKTRLYVGTTDEIWQFDGNDWKDISSNSDLPSTAAAQAFNVIFMSDTQGLNIKRHDSNTWTRLSFFQEEIAQVFLQQNFNGSLQQTLWVITATGEVYTTTVPVNFLDGKIAAPFSLDPTPNKNKLYDNIRK